MFVPPGKPTMFAGRWCSRMHYLEVLDTVAVGELRSLSCHAVVKFLEKVWELLVKGV
jgi:hypothetical protein